jgi:hypothetical protein
MVKSINLNDFYVTVDLEKLIITDKIQKLPPNWKNISGMGGLSEKELSDLEWAGHKNLGWINITSEKIDKYISSSDNMLLNKTVLKNFITEERKKLEEEPIEYETDFAIVKIKPNIKNLHTLSLIKHRDVVNYKSGDYFDVLEKKHMEDLCAIIEDKIQEFFDWECNIYMQIDSCSNVSDFKKIVYDF